MNACVLHAIGDLRYEERPMPVPGPGELLIRVGACGVCGSDIPRVFEKGTYRFPLIPGHEFAGHVEAAGEGVKGDWPGAAVAVFPLLPCRRCAPCGIGAYAQCEDYDYLGSRRDGAFADYVCAPEWNVLRLPSGVSVEAGAMVEPAAVAAHALRQGQLDLGDSVLIFGAGPIGLMLGQWARIWGAARVLLVDVDGAKLDFARRLGFDHVFNPRLQGNVAMWVEDMLDGGADVVVEASGSAAAYEQCMGAARTFGRVVLMGNPAGDMALSQKAYWALLRKELRVVGTWNSVYGGFPKDEWRMALDAMAAGTLCPVELITHRVSLAHLPAALEMMRGRTEFFNKVMYVR